MDNINRSTNAPVIVLLAGILIAVLGFGGYFVVKDIISTNNSSSQTQNTDNNNSDQDNLDPSGGNSGNSGSSDQPVSTDIDATIITAETRGVNFHIEAQTTGVIDGKCDITLVPTDGSQGHHETVALSAVDQNSICMEDISLKGLNPGEHKLTIVVLSTDGRTKTLEQIVKL